MGEKKLTVHPENLQEELHRVPGSLLTMLPSLLQSQEQGHPAESCHRGLALEKDPIVKRREAQQNEENPGGLSI